MADDSLYIDDGYSRTSQVPAAPGLYPAVAVEYRPALPKDRLVYAAKLATKDPEQVEKYLCELFARQKVALNGDAVTKERAGKIHPALRDILQDLVFGYTPAQESADVKN